MNKVANWIGTIVGIIGIALSFYFYFNTREKRAISYTLDTISYKIYDNSLTKGIQKISLYSEDSLKIDRNVYLVTVTIWNSGNIPIEKKDIRKEPILIFKGIDNILDYKIIKEIDPGVSNFKLERLKKSSFKLDWKYFDPNGGLKIQILYTGNTKLDVELKGKILKTDFNKYVPIKEKKEIKFYLFITPIFLLILSYGIFLIYKNNNYFLKENTENDLTNFSFGKQINSIFKFTIIFLFIVYLIMVPLIYYIYFYWEVIPI